MNYSGLSQVKANWNVIFDRWMKMYSINTDLLTNIGSCICNIHLSK